MQTTSASISFMTESAVGRRARTELTFQEATVRAMRAKTRKQAPSSMANLRAEMRPLLAENRVRLDRFFAEDRVTLCGKRSRGGSGHGQGKGGKQPQGGGRGGNRPNEENMCATARLTRFF